MRLLDEVGSAALEASVAMAFLTLVVSGGLMSSYLAFARVWISRSAYEGVICLSTDALVHECKKKTEERIEHALPLGRLTELKMRRSRNTARVEIRFQLGDEIVMGFRERRELPLKYDGVLRP